MSYPLKTIDSWRQKQPRQATIESGLKENKAFKDKLCPLLLWVTPLPSSILALPTIFFTQLMLLPSLLMSTNLTLAT